MITIIVIAILILFIVIGVILICIPWDIYKKLESIKVEIMYLESRQKRILFSIEKIQTSIDSISFLLDDIDETLDNGNKKK